jgi:predicted Zn-dependent peptidase
VLSESKPAKRVLVKKNQGPFITFKVFVKAGSRQDDTLPGLAHLAEHSLPRSYNSSFSYDLYYQIDRLGGKINATTTKEYTEYSLVILKENFFSGLQLLSEILTNPVFRTDDIEQEKEIVFEEILNSYSRPGKLWDTFCPNNLARIAIKVSDSWL